MARYRPSERRWIHAASVAGGYLVFVASLFILEIGAGLRVPISVAVSAPPLVYAALAMLLLRRAPFVRRLSWVGGACVVHVLLGALAAAELTWAGGLSLPAAVAQVFVLFPPALALTLIATPLALTAFGLTASKPAPRTEPLPPRQPSPAARQRPIAPPPRAGRGVSEAAVAVTPTPSASRPPMPVVPAAPSSAVPAAPPAPVANHAQRRAPVADDGMVRVPFAPIAAQLPAEAFVLPFERLGESLREPHVVLVPRRVVLSHLRDDGVTITWAHIASQFPDLALGMSDDEFRKQYPDLKLVLPLDALASQLPAGVLPVPPFPEPARAEIPVAVTPSPAAAPVTSPPAAPTFPPPVPRPTAPPRVELVGREALSGIVACFGGVGSFECAAERVAGSTVVALVEPGLPREAATACAGRLLPFLTGAAGEVVTVRTERAVVILAAAAVPIVVAARRPGSPVALLSLRAVRAAAAGVEGAPSIPSSQRRALEPLSVDRAAPAALTLRSFGTVEPSVFADGPARVYVFSAGGGDDKAVGMLALDVSDALGDGGDLGRVRAVLFRRGGEHTLVRPLSAGVLAASGPVTRPGRILRDADRAAALLEAM